MQQPRDIFDQIEAYLADDVSHEELFAWLLDSADDYAEASDSGSEVNVWARTLNMLCLLQDSAVDESVVRQELQALAANRPASIYRIEISKSLVEQGGTIVYWGVPSVHPGNSDSMNIPSRTKEWAIAR